jgi:hypothetical protein
MRPNAMIDGKRRFVTAGDGSPGNVVVQRFLSTGVGEIGVFGWEEKNQDRMPSRDMLLFVARRSVGVVFRVPALMQVPKVLERMVCQKRG